MADTDQIKVVIRVRPLIQREQQSGQDARWTVQDERKISQKDQTSQSLPPYVFDQIFDRDCSTWDLYGSIIAPIVEAAMNGYHGTVFAYGQSGSGKTHTMSGSKLEPGTIGLAMQDIFDFIEQKPSHEFLMRASYMEIYNEKIFDLLSNDERTLKLQETPDHQITVAGLDETLINCREQVFQVIKNGNTKRTIAETKQNDRSSRSHCIFRIIIESRKRNEVDAAVMVSHLNFVDLAGSEKAGENSGDRFKEGCAINKSLFYLSQVISKLSEGVGNQFIPYRDSKLTRILQNALGGNSKTAIICTINPTATEESHSTLKFASRAKTIKNKPHVNEVLSEAAMLKKYRNEISRLTKLVNEMGVQDIQMANEDLKKQLEDKQQLIKQLTQQIVVSSTLSENHSTQKKKQRRETWCAPKLRRKSLFPSLSAILDRHKITIREETALDPDIDGLETFDLPHTTISVSPSNESHAKAFLMLSEGHELEKGEGKGLFVSPPLSMNDDGRLVGNTQNNSEVVEKIEYEQLLLQEEMENLKILLWYAEEQNERLEQKVQHLCDKRYDISLREWEVLEADRQTLQEEKHQLKELLTQRIKEVENLQKALAGQEPYILRLEQQLMAQVEAGNGQLASAGGTHRRSAIPVEESSDSPQSVKTQRHSATADVNTSTEDLSQSDCADVHAGRKTMVYAETVMEWLDSAVVKPVDNGYLEKVSADAETCTDVPYQDTDGLKDLGSGGDSAQKQTCDTDVQTEDSAQELLNASQDNVGNASIYESLPDSEAQETKESNEVTVPVAEGNEELETCLRELEQELQQQSKDNKQLNEMLNQANAEILRLKQAMEAMEQADAERLEEVAQIPKLKSQLARRDMEIQRLEARTDRLMEELGHTTLNNSGLSSSFSETPRRSLMLAEREAEVWQLKERMVRQAQSLEDMQHENGRLEDLVIDLRTQLDEQYHSLQMAKARASQSSSLDSADLAAALEQVRDEVETFEKRAVDKAELESLQRKLYNQESQITRLEAMLQEQDEDIEILFEKNVMVPKDMAEARIKEFEELKQQVDQLEEQLAAKNNEIKKLKLTGTVTDVAEVWIKEFEELKQEVDQLEKQLAAKDDEIRKLKLSATVQQRGASQGEEDSFQEQLVLEKLTLEEALQEKAQELEDLVTKNKDLELKLDERRNMVNQLRQEQENLTELLFAAQQELTTLKQAYRLASDNNEVNTVESEDEKPELQIESTPKRSEVGHVPAVNLSTDQLEMLNRLKQKEQELLELLEQKEMVESLKQPSAALANDTEVQREQEGQSAEKKLEESVRSIRSHDEESSKPDTSNEEEGFGDITSGAATEHSLKVLDEEKITLELKLQELTTIAEEKAVFEAKVQELSVLVEKVSMIASLETQMKELANSKPQAEVSESKEAASAESESVAAKLATVEEEKNSLEKRLEEVKEEKDAAEKKVLELEAKLSELMSKDASVDPGEGQQDIKADLSNDVSAMKASLRQIQEERELSHRLQSLDSALEQARAEKEELSAEVQSLKTKLEHMKEAGEELKAELTWQTQTADELHAKLDQLEQQKLRNEADAEEQISKLTQETEDLVQELEKNNQLLESSEQCQRVMEETLENHKKNIEVLEADHEKLAAERDAFELKEEAAQKQMLKLKQQAEQLESQVAVLERQLENEQQSKQHLAVMLEDRVSAQQVHQKLSQELQESQVEVLDLQATLSKLQPAVQRQEAQVARLQEVKVSLEEERDHLRDVKATLEAEKEKLSTDLLNSLKKAETLERELHSLRGVVEEKANVQSQLDKCMEEMTALIQQMQSLKQQVEADSSRVLELEQEKDQVLADKEELAARLKKFEADSRHHLAESTQHLQKALEEVQHKASEAEKECCMLRQKTTQQSVQIEELKKDLESARAQASSAATSQLASGEMVPVIEFKKMKFMLKNKIRDLTAELEKVKDSASCKDVYMKELMQKVADYEDPENAAGKDKEIENLTNALKRKNLELSYVHFQHQKELEALAKQLNNAQEMITYKESSVAKLKGEIRRIRSEEVSFCAPAAQKPQPAAPAPVQPSSGPVSEERVISSHSGIIDRYTVTLLEADKYKLQKELRKLQDRLKKTETELHLTKVALSNATGSGEPASAPPLAKENFSEEPVIPRERLGSALRTVSPAARPDAGEAKPSTDSLSRGHQRPLMPQFGSPVDGVRTSLQNAGESCGDSSSVFLSSGPAVGSSVDCKRDRPPLLSVSDKENVPQTADMLASSLTSPSKPDARAEGESPLNIEPEFWKKPVMPPRLKAPYKPLSSRQSGLRSSASECKQQ